MNHFIDRRKNPKDKSLGNRRRFLKRVRSYVKRAVDQSVRDRKISDVDKGEKIGVPTDGISEPTFHYDGATGRHQRVLPGNKEYHPGDRIRKPPQGAGGRGKAGSDSGDGEDEFLFVLSRDEFLDVFFEDLELPDLVKRHLKEIEEMRLKRAGYARTGNPANLSVSSTMKNALGRRIALRRPKDAAVKDLQAELFALENAVTISEAKKKRKAKILEELEALRGRQAAIPYIDPLDVRYRSFDPTPEPNTQAVMVCLMDVSASMGEREKDLAKRFFILLHLFLKRRYERIEIVFIRHTHNAQEVDEETFFYSRETGGTVVSTALSEMKRVIEARYPASGWNIYAAQASDGDNMPGDSQLCREIMALDIMPACQYFAYIEILDEAEQEFLSSDMSGGELWTSYRGVASEWRNFAMKRIARPADIYPVFRELFRRDAKEAVDG
ncbi:MAG: YeaH/YhbH family protein [Pseudomonadota bacterium]